MKTIIDKQLLEASRIIKNSYQENKNKLDNYKEEVIKIGNFIIQKSKRVKEYENIIRKEAKSLSDVERIVKRLVVELDEYEIKKKSVLDDVNKIVTKIEELQKEEIELYNTLKERYPDLTDEDLNYQVNNYIISF